MRRSHIGVITSSIVVGVLLFDQLTKWWANQQGLVSLNEGIAFGWRLPIWLSVAIGCIVVISLIRLVVVAIRSGRTIELLWLSLVVGGALSNLLDRVRLGGVQDWLSVPLTKLNNNAADWAIVLGCLGLLMHLSRGSRIKHIPEGQTS